MMFVSFNNTTTGVTSGAGNDSPSGAIDFTIGFRGFRFIQSSVFCVVFFTSLFVLFVLFLLAIMSVFLPFTASDLQTILEDYILIS